MLSRLPAASEGSLSFTSHNEDRPTTIILIHGGFTCGLEFERVLPHLSGFHVLIPDMPLHSNSRHIRPGTTENSAQHVAKLIRLHAHGGKAHVVGVSMGGYIAQCLALDQPDLVLSLFVTGAAPPVGRRLFYSKWTTVTYYTLRLTLDWLPAWVFRKQMESEGVLITDEMREHISQNSTWELVQEMQPWIVTFSLENVSQLKVRTLSIAGAKGDDVAMIERTAKVLRSRRTDQHEPWPEDESGAVIVREATHGWDMQLPELFAQGVSAWVLEEGLPDSFERVR